MTITQLQKFLASVKRKHGDIQIYFEQFSDYRELQGNDTANVITPECSNYYGDKPRVTVAGAVRGAAGAWVRRDPPKEGETHVTKTVILLFPGN